MHIGAKGGSLHGETKLSEKGLATECGRSSRRRPRSLLPKSTNDDRLMAGTAGKANFKILHPCEQAYQALLLARVPLSP